jgi:hypothetical protein
MMKGLTHALLALALLATTACGDDKSSANPAAPSSSSTPALNLAGTWSGTLGLQGESDPTRIRSWVAAQSGNTVTGPVIVIADGGDGQEGDVPATLSGTVSGTQLTNVTFTVTPGAIPDPSLAACGFSGTGTFAATASSLSGTLAMTFPPACVGEELVSNTPTATWIFTLAK